MIKVFFSIINELPDAETERSKLMELPFVMQQNLVNIKSQRSRTLSLCGKLLLKEQIRFFKLENILGLTKIQYNKTDKPFFNHHLSFNISHSNNIVVCAATTHGELGIDVENLLPLEIELYQNYFTIEEWQKINDSTNRIE